MTTATLPVNPSTLKVKQFQAWLNQRRATLFVSDVRALLEAEVAGRSRVGVLDPLNELLDEKITASATSAAAEEAAPEPVASDEDEESGPELVAGSPLLVQHGGQTHEATFVRTETVVVAQIHDFERSEVLAREGEWELADQDEGA